MMGRKITDLDAHASPASTDLLFIHDSLTGELKRVLLSALFAGLGGVRSDIILDFDIETVQPGGTNVVFEAPFQNTNYVFLPYGMKDGEPVDVTIGTVTEGTKSAAQILVTPAEADTELLWIALGRRS